MTRQQFAEQSCVRKVAWPSFAAADEARQRQFLAHGVRLKVYQCELCRGYHLAKEPGSERSER